MCGYCGAPLDEHRRREDVEYCQRQADLFAAHPEWAAA